MRALKRMEKTKIDRIQFFILIIIFHMSIYLTIPLASGARRDAWIVVLISAFFGILMFMIYYKLYTYYPTELPSTYINKIVGKILGKIISFGYIIYFIYICSEQLRHFGDLMITIAYLGTPIIIINSMILLLVIYATIKGIEVIARTALLSIPVICLIFVFWLIVLPFSEIFKINNLQPILENGWGPVFSTIFTNTIYIPYGHTIVFLFILPYLKNRKYGRTIGSLAIFTVGCIFTVNVLVNLAVLGPDLYNNTVFPLLRTVQLIRFMDFIERLDVMLLILIFIGNFFKIVLFFYVAVMATKELINLDDYKPIVIPFATIVLFFSMAIASNHSELIQVGIETTPLYLHLPFQMIIPVILLGIAFIRNRTKKNGSLQEKQQNQDQDYVGYNTTANALNNASDEMQSNDDASSMNQEKNNNARTISEETNNNANGNNYNQSGNSNHNGSNTNNKINQPIEQQEANRTSSIEHQYQHTNRTEASVRKNEIQKNNMANSTFEKYKPYSIDKDMAKQDNKTIGDQNKAKQNIDTTNSKQNIKKTESSQQSNPSVQKDKIKNGKQNKKINVEPQKSNEETNVTIRNTRRSKRSNRKRSVRQTKKAIKLMQMVESKQKNQNQNKNITKVKSQSEDSAINNQKPKQSLFIKYKGKQ